MFLVGGVVRDALLARSTGDVDLAVGGDASALGRDLAGHLGGQLVSLDEARNLVRIVVRGRSDRAASIVDIGSMPEGGITSDLARRDFTIDAIATPLCGSDLAIIDPFGGRSDLDARLIRAVAPSVFQADPARLVRGPRLAAQLGFDFVEETARQIRTDADLVTMVAPERVRDELLKLMAEPGVAASLRLLDDLGLLCRIIPELADSRGVTQPKEHYWDVFRHQIETAGKIELIVGRGASSADAVLEAVPGFGGEDGHFGEVVSDGHTRLTLLKLAGLLHDVAKPATKTVEPSGRIRFLGHHKRGAEIAEEAMRRLRFSKRGTELVRLMVENHLRPGQMAKPQELPTGRAIFRYFRDLGDATIDTLYLNLADYLAARGPLLDHEDWSRHCRVVEHVMSEGLHGKAPETLPNLIDGHDIMITFSLSPGPQIGTLLAQVEEAQAEDEISTREEALELVRVNMEPGAGRA